MKEWKELCQAMQGEMITETSNVYETTQCHILQGLIFSYYHFLKKQHTS